MQNEIDSMGAVGLAKEALFEYIKKGKVLSPPLGPEHPLMTKRAGVFVSLKKGGQLRGCMGTFLATKESVAEEIIENAILSAASDPRFPKVTKDELGVLDISVDIVSELTPVVSMSELNPKTHGVLVSSGGKRGLLLPNLQGVDTVEEQVRIAKSKAGITENEPFELFSFTVQREESD